MKPGSVRALIGWQSLWLMAVAIGTGAVWKYSLTPGAGGQPPSTWPSDSRIPRHPGRATLVMLVHPQCPCSRASIGELAVIMARSRGLVNAHVLVLKPEGQPEEWAQSDLWRSAATIPGVTVTRDDGGREAGLFEASYSGQTLLYDTEGQLRFNGGITAARGHSGDNEGRNSVLEVVTRGTAKRDEAPVFGCSLRDPDPSFKGGNAR